MSSDDLIVRVPYIRVRRGLNVEFQSAGKDGTANGPPTPLARCLAKAHALTHLLAELGPGAISRQAERWAVSRQRLAQIHALTYLAPDLQESVLIGTLEASRMDFHTLVKIARIPLWQEQREAWRKIGEKVSTSPKSHRGTKGLCVNTPSHSPAPPEA